MLPRALALACAAGLVAVPIGAQAQPSVEVARVRRLALSERPAAALAALVARLDAEAARTSEEAGTAGALHEALCVLTAHDPLPARSMDPDDAWSTPAARRDLARAWHEIVDPTAGRPFGELRRAGLAAARAALYGNEAAEQYSLIRRLSRARTDRGRIRLAILELWDLGAEHEPLERARAFGRRLGLYPPTPAEIREHCRVHCCS